MRASVIAAMMIALLAAQMGCQRTSTPAPATPPQASATVADASSEQPAEQPDYARRRVNLSGLREVATVIAEGTWWRNAPWRSNQADVHIESIEITHEQVIEDKLLPGERVHLVVADVTASWWKQSCQVLMVLLPQEMGGYEPLLVFDGNYRNAGMEFEVIDLGTRESYWALVVTDHWCGMSVSGVYTHVFVHVERSYATLPELREVLDEQTTCESVPWGEARYTDTKIEFRDGDRELKDIVISAYVEKWHGGPDWSKPKHEGENPDYYQTIDERRTWVFRWDGERYEGEIDLSE